MRAYLAERGLGDEVSREFRLGLSRGTGLVAKARESGFTPDEIRAAGLANQRGNDYFPFRLMFPLADARGRIVGFQARKLRDDDPLRGKYVNTPESDAVQEGERPLRAPSRPAGDREAGPRDRRRGQHGRDRAPPGRGRAGRRVDGHRAHRAPAAGARPAHEAPLPLLRRRRGRAGGDAARDAARREAGVRRARRRAAEGRGPGRRARLVRGAARCRGELPLLPRPDRPRADGRPAGGVRSGARDPRARRRTRRSARRRCGCSPIGSTSRARRSPGLAPSRSGSSSVRLAPPGGDDAAAPRGGAPARAGAARGSRPEPDARSTSSRR